MEILGSGLLGYLIGCINLSFFLGKIRGFDIRKSGSGNAGASNALIMMGKSVGIFVALFDIFKCFLAITIVDRLFRSYVLAKAIAGVCCVLGHVFPFYMHFQGGKGLACFAGMVLRYNWKVFLMMLAGEIVIVLVTDYICMIPITASILFPMVYYHMTRDTAGALLYSVLIPVILYRHRINLIRIADGREGRVSYLWKKNAEISRMREAYQKVRDVKKNIGDTLSDQSSEAGQQIKVILWAIDGTVLKDVRKGSIRFYNNALETIHNLRSEVKQCAVMNGDAEEQMKRIARSGLERMLDDIFISDEVGVEMSDGQFFDSVLEQLGPYAREEILLVGSSLMNEICGGNSAGIRCCWYNPDGRARDTDAVVDMEIDDLGELPEILRTISLQESAVQI